MARFIQKRKRSRPLGGVRKKRRFNRRRRTRRGPRTNTSLSNRSLTATSTGLGRGRMLSKKAWKSWLWKDTIADQKYKSNLSGTVTFTSPASAVTCTANIFDIFDAANPFWTATGGLQQVNLGTGIPSLSPNKVVIRGGVMWASISTDPASTTDVRVRVQFVYPKQQRAQFNSTVTTNVPINDWSTAALALFPTNTGLTLQQIGDYEQYWWNPIVDKEIILKPGDAFEIRRAIRIKRVDQESIKNSRAQFPRVFIYTSNLFNAVAQTLRLETGYNLSFCVRDL